MAKKSSTPRRLLTEDLQRLRANRPTAYAGYLIIHEFSQGVPEGGHADRAMVLVCTSLLELALEDAISTHFEIVTQKIRLKLFTGDMEKEAPLQSLYARSYLAYALGIFGERTLEHINGIREIRNYCAHTTTQFSFDQDEMQTLRDLLPGGKKNALLAGTDLPEPTPRATFLSNLEFLFVYLFSVADRENLPKRYKTSIYSEFFS